MMSTSQWLAEALDYGTWMMERLAASCREHGLENDERIVFLFKHTVNARRIWLERVRDRGITTSIDEDLTVAQSLARNAVDTQVWMELVKAAGDEGLVSAVSYSNLRGEPFTQLLRDIVFHVINHTTHHMDEVSVRIRAAGYAPPPTDHIVYTRSK